VKIATYPQRKCRGPVHGDHNDGSCEIVEWHRGPCADTGIPASVARREAWEKANPEQADAVESLGDPYRDEKPS
jgi:hypothetical protein